MPVLTNYYCHQYHPHYSHQFIINELSSFPNQKIESVSNMQKSSRKWKQMQIIKKLINYGIGKINPTWDKYILQLRHRQFSGFKSVIWTGLLTDLNCQSHWYHWKQVCKQYRCRIKDALIHFMLFCIMSWNNDL